MVIVHPLTEMVGNIKTSGVVTRVFEINYNKLTRVVRF
jgi:hypothetical protein